MTKAEIHIPDSVAEAGAKALERSLYQAQIIPGGVSVYAQPTRAILTAALAEWVKCGMAYETTGLTSFGRIYSEETTPLFEPENEPDKFPILIIRTEAP